MSYLTNPYRYVAGVTYPDSCGTSANGIVDGATVVSGGKFDDALSFDGIDDWIGINSLATGCGVSTEGTISLWAEFTDLGNGSGTRKFCAFGDADGNTFLEFFFTNLGALYGACRLDGVQQWKIKTADDVITTSGIYYCVLTQDGTSPKLYINGTEDTTIITSVDVTAWVSSVPTVDEFRLGTQYHSGVFDGMFYGKMSDIGIYDKDIGSSLITDLWNGGAGAKISSISTDGCIAYYQPTALSNSTLTNNAKPT